MRLLSVVLPGVLLTLVACNGIFEPRFPPAAIAIAPSSQYRTWWSVVESCSGRRSTFESVTWYTIPVGQLKVKGEMAAGAWFPSGNRIVITDSWKREGALVRHEMLHAVLQTASHPAEFFQQKCGQVVACPIGDCAGNQSLPDAIESSIDALQVDAELHPPTPSFTGEGGLATVLVKVRNPTNATVFVPVQSFAASQCPIGYVIESTSLPAWTELGCSYPASAGDGRIYFRPGQTVTALFEVNLGSATYGARPHPGDVRFIAIIADNFRKTIATSILP